MTTSHDFNLFLVCQDQGEGAAFVKKYGHFGKGQRFHWQLVANFDELAKVLTVQNADAVFFFLDEKSGDAKPLLLDMEKIRAYSLPLVAVAEKYDSTLAQALLSHGVEDFLSVADLSVENLARLLTHVMVRHVAYRGFEQASQTKFHQIIEANSDGILVVNEEGDISFANPAVGKIFEIDLHEVVGKRFDFYILTRQREKPSSDLEDLSLKYISLLSTTGNTTELEIDNEKGEIKMIEMKASRIPWQGQNAYLVLFHDVTHVMRLQRLKAEIFERERVARMKDEFISTVSHEIRTPLAIVKCAVENMRDGVVGQFTDKQNRIVKIASANVDRLTKLIDDILDLSKLESGKISMNLKPVSLNKLFEDTVRRFKLLAHERNIKIRLEAPFNLPVIYADPDRITQVMDNLLSNALKFAKARVAITARAFADLREHPVKEELRYLKDKAIFVTPGGGVEIIIHDDGPGIPADKSGQLFNKFVQLDRADGGAGYKGTGLGLSICKEIVEMHHGVIWVDGKPGEGAKFHFLLPENPQAITASPEQAAKL